MRMQHVICPACGQVFRTRAHSVGCSGAPLEADLVKLAGAVHRNHLKDQLEVLIASAEEEL